MSGIVPVSIKYGSNTIDVIGVVHLHGFLDRYRFSRFWESYKSHLRPLLRANNLVFEQNLDLWACYHDMFYPPYLGCDYRTMKDHCILEQLECGGSTLLSLSLRPFLFSRTFLRHRRWDPFASPVGRLLRSDLSIHDYYQMCLACERITNATSGSSTTASLSIAQKPIRVSSRATIHLLGGLH